MIERTKERVRNGGKREKKKDREKYREEAREMYSRKIDLRVGRGLRKCPEIFCLQEEFFYSIFCGKTEERGKKYRTERKVILYLILYF